MIELPEAKRTSISETARTVLSYPEGERLQRFFVAVSCITRHYGGPEEGGWWYDWRNVEDVRKVFGIEGVISVLEKLGEEYPCARHDRYSVLGHNGDYEFAVCTTQDELPEDTQRRPTYE